MIGQRPANRVELPVLCKFLRCKSGFGAIENDIDWRMGTSTTEVYWCLSTMESFGPDDDFAHATVCAGSGRACYRREE